MPVSEIIKDYGIFITLVAAVISYYFKNLNDRRIRKRNDALNLVNKRLEEFYGPLYFRAESGRKSFEVLLQHLGMNTDGSLRTENLTEQQYAEWRMWYTNIFHPNNLQEEKIIIEKSYLIMGDKIPECLIAFIKHLSFYKALLKKWEMNDFSNHFSIIDYPTEMKKYIHDSYNELKKEQKRLIEI